MSVLYNYTVHSMSHIKCIIYIKTKFIHICIPYPCISKYLLIYSIVILGDLSP